MQEPSKSRALVIWLSQDRRRLTVQFCSAGNENLQHPDFLEQQNKNAPVVY